MSNTSEHSPAFKIFHYYYKVYIPQSHLYSRDYIQQFGIPTSGNKAIDREMANSKTLAQLTIAQMADHFSNGANMILQESSKSVEIYGIIRDHLLKCKQQAENPVGGEPPPMDDLRKLDELATELYKIAKGYMNEAPEDSNLFRRLDSLGSRRAMRRERDLPEERRVPEEHTPISDAIAKANFQRTKQWR